jgi:hypothetical protein
MTRRAVQGPRQDELGGDDVAALVVIAGVRLWLFDNGAQTARFVDLDRPGFGSRALKIFHSFSISVRR